MWAWVVVCLSTLAPEMGWRLIQRQLHLSNAINTLNKCKSCHWGALEFLVFLSFLPAKYKKKKEGTDNRYVVIGRTNSKSYCNTKHAHVGASTSAWYHLLSSFNSHNDRRKLELIRHNFNWFLKWQLWLIHIYPTINLIKIFNQLT